MNHYCAHRSDRISNLMCHTSHNASNCCQTLPDCHLTGELLGTLPRGCEAPARLVERQDDAIQLTFPSLCQHRQVRDVMSVESSLDVQDMTRPGHSQPDR